MRPPTGTSLQSRTTPCTRTVRRSRMPSDWPTAMPRVVVRRANNANSYVKEGAKTTPVLVQRAVLVDLKQGYMWSTVSNLCSQDRPIHSTILLLCSTHATSLTPLGGSCLVCGSGAVLT